MQKSGFSLVELSIVLVILGLLTGGILAGQSLIRAAELRSVSTEYYRYITAAQSFRDKYFALPGDMTNAQNFWGILDPDPATCRTTPATSTATCNGDGNGSILYSSEGFRFWQHLANAGLIEGTYTGITGSAGVLHAEPGKNSPIPKLGGGSWLMWYYEPIETGNSKYFTLPGANWLTFGAYSSGGTSNLYRLLSAPDLWNIDLKMDDGKPATGKLNAYPFTIGCTNATGTTDYSADYALTYRAANCAAMFNSGL